MRIKKKTKYYIDHFRRPKTRVKIEEELFDDDGRALEFFAYDKNSGIPVVHNSIIRNKKGKIKKEIHRKFNERVGKWEENIYDGSGKKYYNDLFLCPFISEQRLRIFYNNDKKAYRDQQYQIWLKSKRERFYERDADGKITKEYLKDGTGEIISTRYHLKDQTGSGWKDYNANGYCTGKHWFSYNEQTKTDKYEFFSFPEWTESWVRCHYYVKGRLMRITRVKKNQETGEDLSYDEDHLFKKRLFWIKDGVPYTSTIIYNDDGSEKEESVKEDESGFLESCTEYKRNDAGRVIERRKYGNSCPNSKTILEYDVRGLLVKELHYPDIILNEVFPEEIYEYEYELGE